MADSAPAQRVATIAGAQHGVIGHTQLRDAGISRSTASRWVEAGRLVRLHRGVYTLGHRSLTQDGWWNATLLAAGPGSALTGQAGCEIWRVLPARHGPIDVIPARRMVDPPPWIRVHRTTIPNEVVARRGLRVTTLERAILDLAEHGLAHDVGSALDQALLLNLLDRRALSEAVSMAHGRHCLKLVRPAIARLSKTGELFLSRTERRVRDELLAVGLPRPEVNVAVHGPRRRCCRPDMLWRDAGLIAEVDGPQHEMPYQKALDRQRDAWLTDMGYRILRFPVKQVDNHLDTVVAHLISALRAAPNPDVSLVAPDRWEQPG